MIMIDCSIIPLLHTAGLIVLSIEADNEIYDAQPSNWYFCILWRIEASERWESS